MKTFFGFCCMSVLTPSVMDRNHSILFLRNFGGVNVYYAAMLWFNADFLCISGQMFPLNFLTYFSFHPLVSGSSRKRRPKGRRRSWACSCHDPVAPGTAL